MFRSRSEKCHQKFSQKLRFHKIGIFVGMIVFSRNFYENLLRGGTFAFGQAYTSHIKKTVCTLLYLRRYIIFGKVQKYSFVFIVRSGGGIMNNVRFYENNVSRVDRINFVFYEISAASLGQIIKLVMFVRVRFYNVKIAFCKAA